MRRDHRILGSARVQEGRGDPGEGTDCYCLRCLASLDETFTECPGCETPFTGAGRFDRVYGLAPSPAFAFPSTPGGARDLHAVQGRAS